MTEVILAPERPLGELALSRRARHVTTCLGRGRGSVARAGRQELWSWDARVVEITHPLCRFQRTELERAETVSEP